MGTNTSAPLLWNSDLRYVFDSMGSRFVAAVWVTGATLPLLAAAVFLVGCCVVPYHGVMHKLMPLCETAASVVTGDYADVAHEHNAVPPAPAREKQEPVKRLVTALVMTAPAVGRPGETGPLAISALSALRSFISLGAVRCEQDVGLHVLDSTFLI